MENKVALNISGIPVVRDGEPLPFDRNRLVEVLGCSDVQISLNLNLGEYSATAWGCDLSADYVSINADYTT
jgi:glutamate N-acetyltransferase/amino-acid N-acetyltransferase